MRILETQKRSGYFWLPSDPENRLPGTLTIRDGGEIELEVLGFFAGHQVLHESPAIDRIVGLVEKEGYATLDDCAYTNRTMMVGGISKARLHVQRALLKIGYDDKEPVVLDEFRFSVEGLDEWLGLSGIQVTSDFGSRSSTITYVPQEEIELVLDKGMHLTFGLSWTLPVAPGSTEAKITQKAHIRLKAPTPTPVDEYIALARLITNFLCFATDETVALHSVFGRIRNPSSQNGEKRERLDMGIVYQSLPCAEQPPKLQWHRMLFRFSQVQEHAEVIVNNWINAYETFQPALDLYFSTRMGAHRFIDSRFLALIQAVETLHRRISDETFLAIVEYEDLVETIVGGCPDRRKEWLRGKLAYGNEISLATRLKRTVEPFKNKLGSGDERKRLIRSIVDTRNYLTHYDEGLRDRVADGAELYYLCERLEGILQLCFFMEIGFSAEQIDAIVDGNERLRNKLRGGDV